MNDQYAETIVNKLEFLQDVTKVHGKVKDLISRDYVFAHIPEDKKEPLAKLISQFYYGFWLKTHIAELCTNTTPEEKQLILIMAQADLERQLIQYNVYVNLKRNESNNPLLELTIKENKEEEIEPPEPMDTKTSLKTMLKGKNKG